MFCKNFSQICLKFFLIILLQKQQISHDILSNSLLPAGLLLPLVAQPNASDSANG